MVASRRSHDIGLIGATGYTGHLTMLRLWRLRPDLRVLASSRRPDHIRNLVHNLNIPIVTPYDHSLDTNAYESVVEFVSRVKVVIACAGPFVEVGLNVVRACIQCSTHYVDVSGEVDFMRRIIDEFGASSRTRNVLVISACGFDSVPSDMGVYFAQRTANSPLLKAFAVVSLKGAPSGGTLRTILSMATDPARRKLAGDAYALNERLDSRCPPGRSPEPFEADVVGIQWDDYLQKWLSPAMMAPINTRVVRRTSSLCRSHPEHNIRYHPEFAYREMQQSTSIWSALMPTILTKMLRPLTWLLTWPMLSRFLNWMLPVPGEKGGPSEEQRKQNWFRYWIRATTQEGRDVEVQVLGKDMYEVTAETIAQAALCVLDDEEQILCDLSGGGVFTPAYALADRYLSRLKTSDLIKFEVKKGLEQRHPPAAG